MTTADKNKSTYVDWLGLQPDQSPYLSPVYLDVIAAGWQLFVSGNFLFPLIARRILGLRLLEQPLLTQHFALVGRQRANQVAYTQLLDQLSAKFHYIDLCLDTADLSLPKGWKSEERVTYRLELPENAAILREHYSQHLRRLLKKPTTLQLRKDVPITEFMPFLKQYLADKTSLPASFYSKSAALLQQPGLHWQICGAYAGNKLVAACAILNHGNQRYYQLVANAPEGKTDNAMHHLIDFMLSDWCGQKLIFDFEGSMIAGLQRFYSGFGAKPYIYTRVSYSKLPWPLSLWKHGIRFE